MAERPTQEEILRALRTIKAVCENSECVNCPFHDERIFCHIQKFAPENWEINNAENWKAFLYS